MKLLLFNREFHQNMTKENTIDEINTFYTQNEHNQNKLVIKVFLWFFITLPLFLLGLLLGIFKYYDYYQKAFCIYIISVLFYFLTCLYYKLKPYSHITKYLLMLTITFSTFMLSINEGFLMYISYIIVPVVSLLYLNKKFTIKILILSFIVMILSLFHRAYLYPLTNNLQKQWLLTHIVSLSIEYILVSLLMTLIANRNFTIIISSFTGIKKQMDTQRILISSYVALLCQKDAEIKKHLNTTSDYTKVICDSLRKNKKFKYILTTNKYYNIISSSLLHDIGLISIPDKILLKETELSIDEFNIYKTHPIIGNQLIDKNLTSMDSEFLEITKNIVLYHHEQWNGKGYPFGLRGEQIPLSARIVFGAITIDELMCKYVAKKEITFDGAMNLIKQMSDNELDPKISQAIIDSKEQIHKVYLNSLK